MEVSFNLFYKEKGEALVAHAAEGNIFLVKDDILSGADVHFNDDLALRGAAYLGDFNMVRYLLEFDANIHAGREEVLLVALTRGEPEVVKMLVEKGADMQFLLDQRKSELDPASLKLIYDIQSSHTEDAFGKKVAAIKAKPKAVKINKPGI